MVNLQSDLSINAVSDYMYKTWLKGYIEHDNVQSIYLIDPSPEQVSHALEHCKFVVVRIFDPFNEYQGGKDPDFEKKILERHPRIDFPQALDNKGFAQFKGENRLRFVVGWNELYYRQGDKEREQNERMTNIAYALYGAGYGVGMGAWAADKSFHIEDIEAGHWDSVLGLAIKYRDFISLDVHEYMVGRTAGEHLLEYHSGFPDSLNDPYAMRPENFGKVIYGAGHDANYHIGRVAYLLDYAQRKFGAKPDFYRGECAHDYKNDGPLNSFVEKIEAQFGEKPRGINSLYNWYAHLSGNAGKFDNEQYNKMLIEDYAWLLENDGGAISNFIFASHPSNEWIPFNILNPARRSFLNWVTDNKAGIPSKPPAPPSTPPQQKHIVLASINNYQVNVRASPSLKGRKVGLVTPVMIQALSTLEQRNADNLNWLYLETKNWSGWVATKYIQFTVVNENCESPVLDNEDIQALFEDISEAIDNLAEKALNDIQAAIRAALSTLKP